MSDVLDIIPLINREFRRLGLSAPAAIHLASHDDGMRFLGAVAQMHVVLTGAVGTPLEIIRVADDPEVWMEIVVCGLAVRWPAQRRMLPGGKVIWQ